MNSMKTAKDAKKTKKRVYCAYKCDKCSKSFSDKAGLVSHQFSHSEETPFGCDLCPYRGKTRKYLRRHVKIKHEERNFECEVCGKKFHFGCKLKEHMRVHTGDKPYKCEECGKAFNSSYSFNTHKLIHTGSKPYQCSFCAYACRDSSTLRKHHARHQGLVTYYRCSLCDLSCTTKARLQTHISEVHLALDTRRLQCDSCEKRFRERHQLARHIRSVHDKSERATCGVCGKVLSDWRNLPLHMRAHVSLRPHTCDAPGCTKRFKDASSLRKHMVTHYPSKQYPCDICGRRFAREQRMRAHLNTHAARVKNVKCDHCGVCFYNKTYLATHIHRKHGRKRQKYVCDMCGLTTTNKPSIVMHIKYGHGNPRKCNDQRLKCKVCRKLFKRQFNLRLHYWVAHEMDHIPKRYRGPNKPKVPFDVKQEPVNLYDDEEYLDIEPKVEPLDEEGMQVLADIVTDKHEEPAREEYGAETSSLEPAVDSGETFTRETSFTLTQETRDAFARETRDTIIRETRDTITLQTTDTFTQEARDIPFTPVTTDTFTRDTITQETRDTITQETSDTITQETRDTITQETRDTITQQTRDTITQETRDTLTLETLDTARDTLVTGDTLARAPQILVWTEYVGEERRPGRRSQNQVDAEAEEEMRQQVKGLMEKTRQKIASQELERARRKYNRLMKKAVENSNRKVPKNILHTKVKSSTDGKIILNKNNTTTEEKVEKDHEDIGDGEQDIGNEKIGDTGDVGLDNIEEQKEALDDIESENEKIENVVKKRNAINRKRKTKICGQNGKLKFNTHQCYVCFKLYQTKEELLEHCKDHFTLCNVKTLKKCPLCDHATNLSITTHLRKKHAIRLKVPYGTFKDDKQNEGSRYYYEVNDEIIKKVEIIPSIKNLNKLASTKIDKRNREKNNKGVVKNKLVKKGKEWIVMKEKVKITDCLLPKFDKIESININGGYIDRLKELYKLAKKEGKKMLFPCDGCDKVCQTLSALKLHGRKHETNPKPFKPKVWKHKTKTVQPKVVKEITNKDNRTAQPKPVVNKHKCDKELIDFYERNVKGSDVEFWQFLKIFNKMGRENINDFDDLQNSSSFGLHYNVRPEDNTCNGNDIDTNRIDISSNDVANVSNGTARKKEKVKKKVGNAFTRVVRLSNKELLRRNEAKKRLREKIKNNCQNGI